MYFAVFHLFCGKLYGKLPTYPQQAVENSGRAWKSVEKICVAAHILALGKMWIVKLV